MNVGIDYGLGKSNIDAETGIRYGVISCNSVQQECLSDLELTYGDAHCPKCGNEVKQANEEDITPERDEWPDYNRGCREYVCDTCEHWLDSEDVFNDEPMGFSYDADGYQLVDCLDNDIFVLKSAYYTFAQFCSPCVPGAGNLDTPMAEGVKTYCLSHDWFDGEKAPYPVYQVSDNTEVFMQEDET
jgi:hypothetical protein